MPAFRELSTLCRAAGLVRAGSLFAFYTGDPEQGDLIAYVAWPVDDTLTEAPSPAQLLVLPPVPEAACVVRHGDGVFPQVYVDLARWMEENGFEHVGAGRDILRQIDLEHPENTVVEINLPMHRPGTPTPVIVPQSVHAGAVGAEA
jgi:hypothetical protein